MRRVVLAALLALWPALGQAQFALIAPTAPNSDNGDRIANTAWVQNFFATGLPLANGKIIIGSAGGVGTPQTMSGDCTLVASGVITCTQAAGNYAVIGGQIIGSPTGGNKGAGTINVATDYYKNNAIIPETVSAPLTLSAAGLLACPACVLVSATSHGDSAYAILSTDRYVYTNAAFTAPRTWTLPAANSLAAGTTIWVQDAQNTVTSTNTLTVSRAGADTINIGGTTLLVTGAGGGITFTTDGVSNWGVPVQTVSTGGSGRQTFTTHAVLIGEGTNQFNGVGPGTNGQLFLGSTGIDPVFATMSQDCTITNAGVITCTKTNNVAFATIATSGSASDLGTGTLPAARITFAAQADQETATSTTLPVTPGRQQFHPSASKAWVNFSGSGVNGAQTVNASYNVSGVSRTGSGGYTVSFTTSFSSANYACVGSASPGAQQPFLTFGTGATGAISVQYFFVNAGALATTDPGVGHIVCFGDQ